MTGSEYIDGGDGHGLCTICGSEQSRHPLLPVRKNAVVAQLPVGDGFGELARSLFGGRRMQAWVAFLIGTWHELTDLGKRAVAIAKEQRA